MKQKRPPGPVGTSCLTCKRRRKKCDQGRPTCERCTEGGYDCLGYNHIQQRTVAAGLSSSSSRANSVEDDIFSVQPSPLGSSEDGNGSGISVGQGSTQSAGLNCNPPPLEVSTYGLIIPSPNFTLDTCCLDSSTSTSAAGTRTTSVINSQRLLTPAGNESWAVARPSAAPLHGGSEIQSDASTAGSPNYLIPPIEPRMARALSALPPDARQVITFVLSQYERLLSVVYFTPKCQQIIHIRDVVVDRLQASSITRCAVFLGAKIVQSVLDRTSAYHRSSFSKSVEQFERKLRLVSSQMAATPNEVQHRLNGFLEVAFLRMRLSNGFLAYQMLSSAAPTFLQIVYSDPTLWPNLRGPPAVSLAHVISTTRYELGHFVLMDIACAMVYGLPQVVEYDTSVPAINVDLHPIECIHACPPEFQICLAEINLRCSKGYISHDWHLIEQRLLSYKPCLSHIDDLESWKVVARLAAVESWRQVLLIYLYMAVCGAASDDPRVQSAVRQTFQLFKTVRRQDPPRINVHFVFQYLIAGACTRSEKQRAYVRERLLDVYDSELWLLPGSEFVRVLDHLWHGAAANGRAFKWSDYIFSRQAALPVPI